MLRSYLRPKKQEREHNFMQNGAQLLQKLITSCEKEYNSFQMFSLQELEKATENFDQNRRTISSADYDIIDMYKGIHMERIILVKRFRIQTHRIPEITEECINEVVVLSQINHRNILKLLGCCVETEVPLLVFEFVDNRTLDYHIFKEYDHVSSAPPVQQLQWQKRLSIAIQIAEAVSYFHMAVSRPIIHSNIKPGNIFLDEKWNAKVVNFGLSQVIPYGETYVETPVHGTFGFLDPEFLHSGKLNEKTDVYGFGCLMLELLTGRHTIDVFMEEYPNKRDWFDRHESSRSNIQFYKRSILKDGETEQMMVCAELVLRCLKLDREERPTMQEVVQELRLVKGSKYHEGEESSST